MYAVANYIFLHPIFSNGFDFIAILLFSALMIIPIHSVFLGINTIGIKEHEINAKSYKDAYFDFAIDYERANPFSKKRGEIKCVN